MLVAWGSQYKYIVMFMIPFGGVLFLLLAAPAQFNSAWGTYPDDSDLVRGPLRRQPEHRCEGLRSAAH